MANAKVKVKILKFVGSHQPGDVIEVSPEMAESLCRESGVNSGEGKIESHRKAILLEEAEAMESAPVDIRKMSSKELADMGKRNIVPTPIDHAFEARMRQMNEGKKVQAPRTLSEEAIEDESAQPDWVPGAKDEAKEEAKEESSESDSEASEEEMASDEASTGEQTEAKGKKKAAASKKAGK